MVGFVNGPSFKVKHEDNKDQVLDSPEVNKLLDTFDFYIPESDDHSLSLADSFLDFDCVKDYIEDNQQPFMVDVKQEEVEMGGAEKFVPGVVEMSLEMGQDDSFRGANVEFDSGVVGKSLEMGQDEAFKGAGGDGFQKNESEGVEKSFEVGREDSCKGTNGEDGVGKIGSLIEEEMGKVSLEGGLDESVSFDVNGGGGISECVGDTGKDVECETGNGVDGCKRSDEKMGVEGSEVESGEMGIVECGGEMSCEIVGTEGGGIEKSCFDGNFVVSGKALTVDDVGAKSVEKVCDVEDSDSEDEDSDSESETETSGSSSSSSSSSSSDDDEEEDDDDNEVEEGEMEVEEGEIRDSIEEEMTAWSDEDEEFGSAKAGPIMSANEVKVLPPVPPVDVTLQPCHVTLPVGVVLSIVGAQVIVEGVDKHSPLNEGSILWITEKRSALGIVDEIFGPVKNPYYMVRYNSENEVPAGIQQGTAVSFVPEFVNHVLNNGNLYKKGYDASGENDEELSEEAEFSDDEKEAEYRRLQKMSKRGPKDQNVENRKRNKNRSKRRGGQWGGDQNSLATGPNEKVVQEQSNQNAHFRPPSLERVVQVPSNQNQHFRPPSSLDQGNCSNSLRPVQAFSGGPGSVPVFPQAPQVPSFVAPSSGVWMNGIPCQPPQSAFPNGLTPNNILQLQQNQAQQSYHMPPFNGMPLQQFSTSQMMPSNFVFPGGQPGFGLGATFAPMNQMMLGQNNFSQLHGAASQNNFNQLHGAASQNNFSQSQAAINMQLQHAINMQGQHPINFVQSNAVGGVQGQHPINFGQSNAVGGVQGQQAPSFVNNGEQGVLPKDNQNEQNCSSQPLSATPASTEGPQNFSSGVNFGRGRNSYRRCGGRFGGGRGRGRGRGRQQSR